MIGLVLGALFAFVVLAWVLAPVLRDRAAPRRDEP
jgi:hypothetical protein